MQRDNRTDKVDDIVCTQFFYWSPILVGALVAFGLGFLLNLFGIGIGLSAYTTNTTGSTVLAIGGFIGLLLGAFVTMFVAGFTSGFMAAPTCAKRNYGVIYGFAAWCLGLLLMGLFGSSLGNSIYAADNSYTGKRVTAGSAEIANTSENVANRFHPSNPSTPGEKTAHAQGVASLSLFLIFFAGAFAAALGGYAGFAHWDRWADRRRDIK